METLRPLGCVAAAASPDCELLTTGYYVGVASGARPTERPRYQSSAAYRAASVNSSSDSASSSGNTSTSLIASRSALMPKYSIPQYDVTLIART